MTESPRKIGSAKELDKFKKSVLDEKKKSASKKRILLCAGAGCIASGSLRLKKALVHGHRGRVVRVVQNQQLGLGIQMLTDHNDIIYELLVAAQRK